MTLDVSEGVVEGVVLLTEQAMKQVPLKKRWWKH